MRLRSITLANFKSFADEAEIPIDRITCIIGPNGAGKSNAIYGLERAAAILSGKGYRPKKSDYFDDNDAEEMRLSATIELSDDEQKTLLDRPKMEPVKALNKKLVGGPLFRHVKYAVSFRNDPEQKQEEVWLPALVEVDGQAIPVLGICRVSDSPTIAVKRCRLAPSGADILVYREPHPYGLCEWGASGLFFGPSGGRNPELCVCYTVGGLRAFLAHLKLVYVKLGLDAPFTVLVSMRNASGLALGNYGDEAIGPPWYVHNNWSSGSGGPRTGSRNIQWRHAFGTVGEMTDGAIAQAARGMAKCVCAEYSGGPPRCYGAGGAFCWKQWRRTWSEAPRRCRP